MSITDWPLSERPRERLIRKGADSLSDAELLAIFLRTGIPGRSAITLARDLLKRFGGLNQVLDATMKEFCEIKGLGEAKYCQLQATMELIKRHFQSQVQQGKGFTNPDLVKMYLLNHFPDKQNEVFACMFLNNKHQLLQFEPLFQGSINQAHVHVRVVVQSCLKHNAAAVIFAHNHPSGCLKPSDSDVQITQRLKQALELIEVRVLDHFIVGNNEVQSMAELGIM